MKTILLFLNILFIISGCQNTANQATTEQKKEATTPTLSAPKWAIIMKGLEEDAPVSQVYLVTKDSTFISKELGGLRELTKEEYTDKKIPASAITACTGFWAGLESRLYVADSADSWVVKAMYIDEGSDGKETFETVKTIKKN
jgi:hypothetical protein